eukprot:TRINITY_DN3575_c0_g1_i3.p2 TRINITY_DN3575_c0_g1~~TRINITY_DN3575_c0_g1_i3.p2  ORF type:complete len:151 (-),score=35.93 TRINITY_DN3575_c0_g1_i3:106-558(-)
MEGAAQVHAQVAEGTECLCCMEDLSNENYVEYQDKPEGAWLASKFCQTCVEVLINTQFEKYVHALTNPTCQAEHNRLLQAGPPINLRDQHAFPCENANGEVYSLWYASDSAVHSAKLANSLVGEEREAFLAYHRSLNFPDLPENLPEESS